MGALAAQASPLAFPAAFLIVLGLLAATVAASGLRRVEPDERLVVRRSGRTRGVREPGLRYLVPLADSGVRVPAGARSYGLWFRAMTRDGVPVRIKALAELRVDDPAAYAASAETPSFAVQAAAEAALRGVMADRDLADLPSLLAGGDDPELVRRVGEAVRPWGVAARLVSVTDATVPVRAGPRPAAPAPRLPPTGRAAAGRGGAGGTGAGRPS
ncbi:SPFH domain-containing protein [Actinomadura madurae]|uniref:SPFH domain-containing protein n=1 Tax=Actinomadura madurae TaxID=1993 RepID=UPI002026BF9C|nr:SPFH domain-containing protein [Actinomadura madurae]URN06885.1 SPFH domain-containing protein [Actinomadura madurae]